MISGLLNLKFQANQGDIVDLTINTKWIYYTGMTNIGGSSYMCCLNIVQTKNDTVNYVQLARINMIPIDVSL